MEELEGVFVARQGRAVFVPVVTGVAGERYFEALSGVAEADLVITGPFSEVRNLEDGRVEAQAEGEQAGALFRVTPGVRGVPEFFSRIRI